MATKECSCNGEVVKAMTKAEMIAEIAESTGLTKKNVEATYAALLDVVAKQASNPAGFTLPGLGKISISSRSARTGRNPATGAAMEIPAKQVLKFTFSKICKDAVLG